MILYGLIFTPRLDDQAVESTATALISRRVFRGPTDTYYQAIRRALESGATLNEGMSDHSEAETRDFLSRLLVRLDELRPWPQPSFEKQDIAQWGNLGNARAIGLIGTTRLTIEDRLREMFDPIPVGDGRQRGLILRLRSGRIVALLAPPVLADPGIALLQPADDSSPAAALAEFCDLTGIPRDQVTEVTQATDEAR